MARSLLYSVDASQNGRTGGLMQPSIQQAVILAAGLGSRLRKDERDYLKPLYPLRGQPLIAYVMQALAENRVAEFHVVVGFEKDELVPGLRGALPEGARLHLIDNQDYMLANGISLLKARGHVEGRFYLSMSDHLFPPEMVATLAAGSRDADCLYLAVDRKLDAIFDMDDATKVRTEDGRIVDIDKGLTDFDAVDTGLFTCPDTVFEHLQSAAERQDGNCSLSDGVRDMAAAGLARVVDIGDAFWQDVDTPDMYGHAESWLASRLASGRAAAE